MEYTSSDFQCPDTGFGVRLVFNEDNEEITAEICDVGIWLNEKDRLEKVGNTEILIDTEDWCKRFGNKYCESFDQANEIAEKYECWF